MIAPFAINSTAVPVTVVLLPEGAPSPKRSGWDTVKGRIVVDKFLTVPGHRHVFAAATPRRCLISRMPGVSPMTAQHAQRRAAPWRAMSPPPLATGPARRTSTATLLRRGPGWLAGMPSPTRCTFRCPASRPSSSRAFITSTPLPASRLQVATGWPNDIAEHRQFVQGRPGPARARGPRRCRYTDIYYRTDGSCSTTRPASVTAAAPGARRDRAPGKPMQSRGARSRFIDNPFLAGDTPDVPGGDGRGAVSRSCPPRQPAAGSQPSASFAPPVIPVVPPARSQLLIFMAYFDRNN